MDNFDIFLKDYKNKIEEFIDFCEDKLIIFDFDGTLTHFQYGDNRMLPCNDADVQKYILSGGNIYKNMKPLKTMQYIISRLDKKNIWILTKSVPAIRNIKNDLIKQNFNLLKKQIIHVTNITDKLEKINKLQYKFPKEVVFVEDNASILLAAEEQLSGVYGIHISYFLP